MAELQSICSVETCERQACCKKWCKMHYTRWKRYGNPEVTRCTPTGKPMEFLHASIVNATKDKCIKWPFGSAHGYGKIRFEGRQWRAHRLVLTFVAGPPPADDMQAAHSCGVRACVNKWHLRWATAAENAADKITHDRAIRGDRCVTAKLTEANVIDVIELLNYGNLFPHEIADCFGVSRDAIAKIQSGRNWKWLTKGKLIREVAK